MAAGNEFMKLMAKLMGGVLREKGAGGSVVSTIVREAGKKSAAPGWSWFAGPMAAGLLGLLQKKKTEPTATEPRTETPKPQRYERGVSPESSWEAKPVERGEGERTRVIERPVQVTIQAMDSRSFFDRQDEIAAAVRRAVLESSGSGEIGEEW